MADNDQLHARIGADRHKGFKSWCAKRGITMTEACLLLIDAALDGRLKLENLKKERPADD